MGKGSSVGQVDPAIQAGELQNQSALTDIAKGQAKNATTLFNLTEPGLVQAEQHYEALASGDPAAIMRAIAPAEQQVSEASAGAKKNILDNAPAGGEKNLALSEVDVKRGEATSRNASGATLAAPNALGQLAGQGISLGQGSAGIATSSLSASNTGYSNLQSQEFQGQQLQMQQKGQTLGALGGLAGDAASIGSAAILACWIAEELYGVNDPRTHLLRSWLNREFVQHWYGRVLMSLYRRYGKRIAAGIRRNSTLRWVFRPLFNIALRFACRARRVLVTVYA